MAEERRELDSILAEVADRVHDGENVDPLEVTRRYPEHAEDILREFPRLLKLLGTLSEGAVGLTAAPDDRLPSGWREIEHLKSGGQGEVLKVEEIVTGRHAAFKRIDPGAEGALREIIAYDRLRGTIDPALVQIYGVSRNGILMELLPGQELGDFVVLRGRPGASAAMKLAGKLGGEGDPYRRIARAFVAPARALQRLHEKKILHRDLKPQNVKLEKDRGLVLLDLGLARVEGLQSISGTEAVLGTYRFLAPEALPELKQPFSERTDVYGLGATLYALLTNRTPHEGDTIPELHDAVLTKTPQPVRAFNPEVPAGLASIVDMAMRKDPAGRYGTALELAQDLERFAAGQTPWAEIGLEALARRRKKHRRIALFSAAAVLLLSLAAWAGWQALKEVRRARDVEAHLADATRLFGAGRVEESLREATHALNRPCEGWGEAHAALEAASRARRRMGLFQDDATHWGTRLQEAHPGDDRTVLLEDMAAAAHEDLRYEGVIRLLHRLPEPLSDRAHGLLLDALLREGHAAEAYTLMAKRGDAEGCRLLDRFGERQEIDLPGVVDLVAVPTKEGDTALLTVDLDGVVHRVRPAAPAGEQVQVVPWDIPSHRPPRFHFHGVPGEVSLTAWTTEVTSELWVCELGRKGVRRNIPDLRLESHHRHVDLDGDGVREDLFFFDYPGRGIEVHGPEGKWDVERMGALAELDAARSDVRDVLLVQDETGDRPLLLVATAGWSRRWGFRLMAFRWMEASGFDLVAERVLGDCLHLVETDLEGAGRAQVYAVVSSKSDPAFSAWYHAFPPSGVLRVRLPDLALEVVHALRPSGYYDPSGRLRTSDPIWMPKRANAIQVDRPGDAIAYALGPYVGDREFLEITWGGEAGHRTQVLPLPDVRDGRPVSCELRSDWPGPELVVSGGAGLVILGQRRPDDHHPAAWRELSLFQDGAGIEPALISDLAACGYLDASADLTENLVGAAPDARLRRTRLEDLIEARLAAGDTDGAAGAWATWLELGDREPGASAYWQGRVAEGGGRLGEALSAYALVSRELGASEALRLDAADRQGRMALLSASTKTRKASFALPSVDGRLPEGWFASDPRIFVHDAGRGLRCLMAATRPDRFECEFDAEDLSAVRVRMRVTMLEQEEAGQVRFGLFAPSRHGDALPAGGYVYLSRGDAGPRWGGLQWAGEDDKGEQKPLTGRGSHDIRWDTPIDIELHYRRDRELLRGVIRDAVTGRTLSRTELKVSGDLLRGRAAFGMRSVPDSAASFRPTRLLLHSAEIDLSGRVDWVDDPVTVDDQDPAATAVQQAWQAWAAGDPEVAFERWQDALSTGEDLVPLMVGPFARPATAFLAALPAGAGGDGVVARLRESVHPGMGFRDSELVIDLLGSCDELTEDQASALRRALYGAGLTAEAHRRFGSQDEPSLPEAGSAENDVRLAARSLEHLQPRTAEAAARRALAAIPSLRVRIAARIHLARAHVMLGDAPAARDVLDRLLEVDGFDPERFKDYADLRRFLRSRQAQAGRLAR